MNDWVDTLLGFVVVVLLVVVVVLIGYLIVDWIDQSQTPDTFYSNQQVVDKNSGTTTTYVLVGKVLVPITNPYWRLTFYIDGQYLVGDVDSGCYSRVNVGDHMDVVVRYGQVSTHVYPVCK